jgi:hypothetical protein
MFKDFLLRFFSSMEPRYGTGALENPNDPRDVQTASFQPENELPEKYITDISMLPRYDQKQNGSCVGHAIALALAYYEYKENGKLDSLSPRFIYGLSKKRDGLSSEGTYPRIGGLVALEHGCATDKALPNNSYLAHDEYITFELSNSLVSDAYPRKIKGFAFVTESEYDLKNAIINNGVVCVSLKVGKWSKLPVKSGDNGRHYILVYGYNGKKFYFANSWGKNWGDKKLGDGYFMWDEFKDSIRDIMVITDIPNKVMQEAKDQWKYKFFKPSEFKNLDKVKPQTLDLIEAIRGAYGKPLTPNSDWRPEGSHLSGCEIDFKATGKDFYQWIYRQYRPGGGRVMWDTLPLLSQFENDEQYKLARVAMKCGATRIGIYDRHVHIGFDPSSPQQVVWAGVSE